MRGPGERGAAALQQTQRGRIAGVLGQCRAAVGQRLGVASFIGKQSSKMKAQLDYIGAAFHCGSQLPNKRVLDIKRAQSHLPS